MPRAKESQRIPERIQNLILDMDGVLWRGDTAAPGVPEFFGVLERLSLSYALVTNNSTRNAQEYADKLARFGVSIPAANVLTSGEATALHVARDYPSGTLVYVIGEDSLRGALSARGFEVIDRDDQNLPASSVPLVVVGLDRQVTYSRLARASALVSAGSRFVGTNPDTTLPEGDGTAPGAGALLAAITAATGIAPEVVGKPGPLLFLQALRQLGGEADATAVVGDRIDTDIAGGRGQGLYTILLLTGVTDRATLLGSEVQPDAVFDNLPHLATALSRRPASPDFLAGKWLEGR